LATYSTSIYTAANPQLSCFQVCAFPSNAPCRTLASPVRSRLSRSASKRRRRYVAWRTLLLVKPRSCTSGFGQDKDQPGEPGAYSRTRREECVHDRGHWRHGQPRYTCAPHESRGSVDSGPSREYDRNHYRTLHGAMYGTLN
jgi:hypothetical protein